VSPSHKHIALLRRLSALPVLVLCAFALWPCCLAAQTPAALHFTEAVVTSHHVGQLSWNRIDSASAYQLFRCYPDQAAFAPIATLADTHFTDTLHRVVCADTVSYCVTALLRDTALRSDTAGLYYQDNIPTAPCSLRLCTVDTLLNRILLSWYPSPDTDVMGYYICMGSPCLDYDTVWGRLNTEYLCPEDLSLDENAHAEFSFRILAFDSCSQASPLTPYYRNPVLSISAEPCSQQLRCSWNRYINMPDSVSEYRLHYTLDNSTQEQTFSIGPDGPFIHDINIPDLAVRQLRAYLTVHSGDSGLMAFSRVQTFRFDHGDTARYANILSAAYLDTVPAVSLRLEIDPDFHDADYVLMRSTATASPDNPDVLYWSPFEPIASRTRPADPSGQGTFTYVDSTVSRTAPAYSYRLHVPDRCGLRAVVSDTVCVLLPEPPEPSAWFPNVIYGGHPDLGRFCPTFVAPLARDYRLDIFSRWGQRVFSTSTLGDCWDGTSPLGKPLQQGVYVYRATCRHADGTLKTYTGTVTLLR
jgi:hypothetical protein